MFGGRGAQCFIADQGEIVTSRELIDPIVHGIDDGAHTEPSVAQHFTDALLPELKRRVGIAPCQLQIQRNETIPRIAREQNDSCTVKLASRDEILASKSVPPITLSAVLK